MEDKSDYRQPDEKFFQDDSKNSSWPIDENEYEDEVDDIEWDGSESELIVDDDIEEYEREQTGIKLKYTLSENEICNIFKHTENYKNNILFQKNQIMIQCGIILILIVLWMYFGNFYYGMLTIFPVLFILTISIAPILSIKRLAKEFFSGEEINAEIYPDKICTIVRGNEREIPLNGMAEYEELAGEIMIYPKDGDTLIIPVRSIDPEFLPDVQAMIVAGTQPRNKK